jgi:flagellar basal-body rod modification protein FlgD
MSTINTNNSNVFEQINTANKAADTATGKSKSQEDSDMFMKLMIAQMTSQDPTSPTDTAEFMGQISNMSQVESMNNLGNSITAMSQSMITSQSALQASSMVGQNVLISTDKTLSNKEGDISGAVALPGNTDNVRLTVTDANGSVVETVDLGAYTAGNSDFKWAGSAEKAGSEYSLKAEAKLSDGSYERIDTYLDNRVTSVTLGQNGVGMQVNTAVGSTSMANVLRIGV